MKPTLDQQIEYMKASIELWKEVGSIIPADMNGEQETETAILENLLAIRNLRASLKNPDRVTMPLHVDLKADYHE